MSSWVYIIRCAYVLDMGFNNVILLCLMSTSHSMLVQEFSCGFEEDYCQWTIPNWSSHRWSRTKYKSILSLSGPSSAYEKEFYIYYNNTILPSGSEAYLQSSEIPSDLRKPCLRFYYHMYGSTMGELEFGLLKDSKQNQRHLLWRINGDQSNTWHCQVIDIGGADPGDSVYIKGVKGSDQYSIIALDNIQLFTDVDDCEPSECENIEDEIITPDSSPRETKSTSEVTTPEYLQSSTLSDIDTSLQWSVGIPAAIVVFGIVIVIILISIKRRRRKKQKAEAVPLQRLNQNQNIGNLRGSTLEERYPPMPTQESVYSEIREVEEHVYTKPTSYESTDNSSKPTSHEYDYVEPEPKKPEHTNGQVVHCEINHQISSSLTDVADQRSSENKIKTDEEGYVTFSK